MICYSTFQYQVTDSHGATSDVAQVEVQVQASQDASSTETTPSAVPSTPPSQPSTTTPSYR